MLDQCSNIVLNGTQTDSQGIFTALAEEIKKLPKFIGCNQKELNKQLAKEIISNKNIFQTDGTGNIKIKLSNLGSLAEEAAKNISANIPQKSLH